MGQGGQNVLILKSKQQNWTKKLPWTEAVISNGLSLCQRSFAIVFFSNATTTTSPEYLPRIKSQGM